MAIGANCGGDELVLMPSPDAPTILGPVHWWDHETGELIFVCDDFAEIGRKEP